METNLPSPVCQGQQVNFPVIASISMLLEGIPLAMSMSCRWLCFGFQTRQSTTYGEPIGILWVLKVGIPETIDLVHYVHS